MHFTGNNEAGASGAILSEYSTALSIVLRLPRLPVSALCVVPRTQQGEVCEHRLKQVSMVIIKRSWWAGPVFSAGSVL